MPEQQFNPPQQIIVSLEDLQKSHAGLGEAIRNLSERLNPILIPLGGEAVKDEDKPKKRSHSEVNVIIQQVAARERSLTAHVRSLLERLDL